MAIADKIVTLDDLARIVAGYKAQGRIVVHCHGVFDLLHIGHIRHLQQARAMGDVLVVTLTPDRFVDKGPHRPAFPEPLRAEAMASLAVVDLVAINDQPTAEETLRRLKPDFFVKGSEFADTASDRTGKIGREERAAAEVGTKLAFTEDIVFSSTNLINRYFSTFPKEIQEYLHVFCTRYGLAQVEALLDGMAGLDVLVIGDAIMDEYHYTEALGKSNKDPILALKYLSHDLFAGGAMAVANHVAGFARSVTLVTPLGGRNSFEDFIRARLLPNVTPHFVIEPGGHTLIKRRFVDGYSVNKLFEIYVIDGVRLSPERDGDLCRWAADQLPRHNAVIAADFGHGAISRAMIDTLVEKAPFLAVNTQANAGNRGFNSITRYPRADFVCLAEHEIRLETRDHESNLRPIMDRVAEGMGCRQLVVTRGRRGCLVRGHDGEFVAVPSFALDVVDRIGAGDALLSVASLAAALDAPPELLGFVGGVAGAVAVGILGNQKSIDRISVNKNVVSLMK